MIYRECPDGCDGPHTLILAPPGDLIVSHNRGRLAAALIWNEDIFTNRPPSRPLAFYLDRTSVYEHKEKL